MFLLGADAGLALLGQKWPEALTGGSLQEMSPNRVNHAGAVASSNKQADRTTMKRRRQQDRKRSNTRSQCKLHIGLFCPDYPELNLNENSLCFDMSYLCVVVALISPSPGSEVCARKLLHDCRRSGGGSSHQ